MIIRFTRLIYSYNNEVVGVVKLVMVFILREIFCLCVIIIFLINKRFYLKRSFILIIDNYLF